MCKHLHIGAGALFPLAQISICRISYLRLWRAVETLARELQLEEVRGREGIWGSAQRSRWKFWARIEGPKDERQDQPVLAFSIWGEHEGREGNGKGHGASSCTS